MKPCHLLYTYNVFPEDKDSLQEDNSLRSFLSLC